MWTVGHTVVHLEIFRFCCPSGSRSDMWICLWIYLHPNSDVEKIDSSFASVSIGNPFPFGNYFSWRVCNAGGCQQSPSRSWQWFPVVQLKHGRRCSFPDGLFPVFLTHCRSAESSVFWIGLLDRFFLLFPFFAVSCPNKHLHGPFDIQDRQCVPCSSAVFWRVCCCCCLLIGLFLRSQFGLLLLFENAINHSPQSLVASRLLFPAMFCWYKVIACFMSGHFFTCRSYTFSRTCASKSWPRAGHVFLPARLSILRMSPYKSRSSASLRVPLSLIDGV